MSNTFYKAVRLDRTSHYDRKTKWRKGSIVKADKCGVGIHCSRSLLDSVGYQGGPSIYCVVDPVKVIAEDDDKLRCTAVRVVRWLSRSEVDKLAGFRLWEANHPVHPLRTPGRVVPEKWLRDRIRGWSDSKNHNGLSSVWASVGDTIRAYGVINTEWGTNRTWECVWPSVRRSIEYAVGRSLYEAIFKDDYSKYFYTGDPKRVSVVHALMAYGGSLFTQINTWKYIEDLDNPWGSLRRLWRAGYVPVFDGTSWTLYAGPSAVIVFTVRADDL